MALGARLLAAGLVLAWLPPAAHAQPRTEIDERLAFVERELEAGQPDARSWRYGWMAVYGGFTLGGLAFAALVPDRGLRIDALVSSAKSGLGFFSIALRPMRAAHGLDDLEALPAATPEQRALRLHRAEQALRQAAEDEELGSSWLARIAAATVNLAGSYVLWLGYQRYASGWLALPAGSTLRAHFGSYSCLGSPPFIPENACLSGSSLRSR